MAEIPLAVNVQGDYGFKVVVVDEGDTIQDVIDKATSQIVGVLVAPPPSGATYKARLNGSSDILANSDTVAGLGLGHMRAIDIVVSDANVG